MTTVLGAPRPVGRRARRVPDDGQATVEFALGLPTVCLLALGVVQVAIVARHQLALESLARAAARTAAVASDPRAEARRVVAGASLADVTVEVGVASVTVGDGTSTSMRVVDVAVRRRDPTDVPLVGIVVPDIHLEARASMPLEPP